ncbi:hypothetical protein ACHAXR_008216, partial [Thalassiosira sp. AJA248-18]
LSTFNIVWAFATAGVFDPALFNRVADEVTHRHLGSFVPQGLSNIVWAYATSKVLHTALFDRMAGVIMGRTRECNNQHLANIAWSYAVANVDASGLFDGHFLDVLLEKTNRFSDAQVSQLYQWHIWQKEEKGNTGLPPGFGERCYEAFTSTKPAVSALQRDVVSVLRSIGLSPKEEQLTQRGFSLDSIVEVNGQKVGVEVDGPRHFIGKKPTGSTLLKRRQIANVERMKLVSVPYWEWNELGQDHSEKQNYLCSLLGVNSNLK